MENQQNEFQVQQPATETSAMNQAVYEPVGIPAEIPNNKGGKVIGTLSIICAIISILFIPILFGPIGIFLGISAKKRGEGTLGLVGIILSSIFMVVGIILAIIVGVMQEKGLLPGALMFFF